MAWEDHECPASSPAAAAAVVVVVVVVGADQTRCAGPNCKLRQTICNTCNTKALH